jgi:hypothetical protein
MQERGNLLGEIGVQILVLRGSNSITAKLIRLCRIHAQNFGER